VQLFDRLKGEVRITAEGRVFESYADRILFWYDTVPLVFESRRNTVRDNLVISIDGGVSRSVIQSLTNFLADVNPLLAVTFCQPSSPAASRADLVLKSAFTQNSGGSAAGVISVEVSEAFASDPLCGVIRRFLKDII